jgi:hypothetical protein
MKMRGRGRGNGRFLVVMVWVLAALGWMGAGEARGQEALSKVEVVSADTAKVSPGGRRSQCRRVGRWRLILQRRHLAIVQTIILKTYSFHRTRNLAPGNPERYTCIY